MFIWAPSSATQSSVLLLTRGSSNRLVQGSKAQRIIEDANGYRDEVVSRAKGEADRFTKLVAEYRKNPEVTRDRLYLDTMQEVFSNTSKVLVTGNKNGQSNLLYLPLDKMIEGRNGSTPATGSAAAASNTDSGSHVSTDLPPQPRTRESR